MIKIYDKVIMLDCGLHMGVNDSTRYPDFDRIKSIWGGAGVSDTRRFDEIVDLVLISHFHLDHIGALPFFTEIIQYDGPIYMTSPTKALLPYMCEDFRKVITET
jgi:integrator complex subunit 11